MKRDYLFEREPGRFALVVGNADYEHLGSLQSAKLDAKTISASLARLGFIVSSYDRLPTVRHFEQKILPAFRERIQPGDLIVFYFSGHGFEYGPDNYIAPGNLPLVVTRETIAESAIAVGEIEEYFARQSPALVLMLIDACRTIAGFVIREASDRSVASEKVAARTTSPERINIVEAYAARAGSAALASNDRSTLSPFTKSLAAHIGTKGVELLAMLRDVAADVLLATHEAQTPAVVSWSPSDVCLNPTDDIRKQEREAWLAALSANTREEVELFSYRHGLSSYAAAARQWLIDDG
jgi:uncharacterized caspase-like protein